MVAYFPDILKSIVEKVSDYTKTLEEPYEVIFKSGIYTQVKREINKLIHSDVPMPPIIWLVMNYRERKGAGQINAASEISCTVIISVKSDVNYTQEERDLLSYKAKLLPIMDSFFKELEEDGRFFPSISRTEIMRPFWGISESVQNNTNNLYDSVVDAIEIEDLQLKLKFNHHCKN